MSIFARYIIHKWGERTRKCWGGKCFPALYYDQHAKLRHTNQQNIGCKFIPHVSEKELADFGEVMGSERKHTLQIMQKYKNNIY